MAARDLILPPHLAPWHQAGVQWLLAQDPLPPQWSCLSEDLPTADVRCARTKAMSAQADVAERQTRETQGAVSPRADVPSGKSTAASRGKAAFLAAQRGRGTALQGDASVAQPSALAASRVPASGSADMPPAAMNKEPVAATVTASPAAFLPPEQWPRIWQHRLEKTRPALVLWTYWELGEDMYGTPNAERRNVLQRFIKDMGHPQGTHSFWPCALPVHEGEPALISNPVVFWSGVEALQSRIVVVMGATARQAIGLPESLKPLLQMRHQGNLVVMLHEMQCILEEPQQYSAMFSFLQGALSHYAR